MELFKMPFILTKQSQILVVGLCVWLSYNWRSVHDFLLQRIETPRCWEQLDTSIHGWVEQQIQAVSQVNGKASVCANFAETQEKGTRGQQGEIYLSKGEFCPSDRAI